MLARGIGGFMGSYSMAYISNHMVHKLRRQIMERLLSLPVKFYDQNPLGHLVSKFTYDVMQITGAVTNAVTVIVREGIFVFALLITMLLMDWRLSMTFIVIAPFVAKLVSVASRRFRRYSKQMQGSMGEVTQVGNESIKGHRVIRTFNAKGFVLEKFSQASERNRVQNMKMSLTEDVSTPIIQLIVGIAMAGLVWYAMSPTFFEEKTLGDFVAFLTLAGLLAKPIRQLSKVNSVLQRGLSAAESIFELLDEPVEADTGDYCVDRAKGKVEFREVGFAYNEKRIALQKINFTVQPGKTIALVGKSGSGKSSLVSLITRFYENDSGGIYLDDVLLQDYKLENLREQISLVTQQVVLFNGTVAENIAYGSHHHFNPQQIQVAAENAHAWEFIEKLPEGLQTQVGDDAAMLSGGQRQRIAIARALLINAPVLILDEATSALDSESEQHIQQALQALMQGRTTFVIAHRLSTIENADQILVLDEGKIVESGTHRELLEAQGAYARLHKIQFSTSNLVTSP
ncbi:MAG: lipid A export permease/ATP-binding protein MsbA [SAR86 cluster bacterium]|uniref:Lipid A export permease/ATP-binding protein MsbA n=1 Tax=SAR86 cluster bacterium TaxID=2030880 RepID=A0A2A4MEF4_9GAMM|nr:MAG: lipid A export permease/ATP-binding protein MsbA [SAR86 cluster bacterium]